MAKLIEFIGVSGVGKSTTLKALEAKWKPEENWLLYAVLLRKNLTRSLKLKEAINFHVKKLFKPHAFIYPHPERSKIKTFVNSHPELMDSFWKTHYKRKSYFGTDLRFHEVEYIKYLLERMQIVHDDTSKKFCIMDEGFIHNLNYFVLNPLDFNQVSQILSLIKLPDAVVYFEADIELIIERILMRKSLIIRDENLSREELIHSRVEAIKEKEIFIMAVKSKNIPVLNLKAEESVREKARKVISFIKVLEKKPSEIVQWKKARIL